VTGSTALTLLAGLLISANRVVPNETLIAWAWPTRRPGNPKGALQNAMSRLRKLIGEDSIATTPWGYILPADGDRLDLLKFRALSSAAAQAVAAGAPEKALTLLDDAIRLWCRPILANVTSEVLIRDALPHLTEPYVTAVEQRAALRLGLRRPAGVPEELAELVREHPFRETLVGHLMVALCQTGRRTEALTAFHELRIALSSELGIAPSPALQGLYGTLVKDTPTYDRWLSGWAVMS
jgi:DNA-binding SARP family transcriptional activator